MCYWVRRAFRLATPADLLSADDSSGLFTANDLSLDLFGFSNSRNKNGGNQDAWGPGLGVNYFLTQNVGVGVDTYADAFHTPYQLNASGIFRYPLPGFGLGPYAFTGFGRQWDNRSLWMGHIGARVEMRFSYRTGVFVDVREVFPDKTKDSTLVRFGVRLKFL